MAAWFEEEKSGQSSGNVEMYSSDRQESMRRQVAKLHQRDEQVASSSEVSKECEEWQKIAKREKHSAHFAQSASSASSAHFTSVRTSFEALRLVHTTLRICCDLQQTVALQIIRKISNYLQCNLALCNSAVTGG